LIDACQYYGGMVQPSLFGSRDDDPPPKPGDNRVARLRLLVTVMEAPRPSERYGDVACVAGLSPVILSELDYGQAFTKYDVIAVDARPAQRDQRRESWRPVVSTMVVENHIDSWQSRRAWLDHMRLDSMCAMNNAAKGHPGARSLALVRPRTVSGLKIFPYGGWTTRERARIDAYVAKPDLFTDRDRAPVLAPRFKGVYQYRCYEPGCKGHEQGLLDWDFVALQRRLAHLGDQELRDALWDQFFTPMCSADHEIAFYVGNKANRANVFNVLGGYFPAGS
jgi:hypothetical protein